jgi:transposase-like protein
MYIRKSNNKTHKRFTIEEKNQIVLLYLDQHLSFNQIIRTFNIVSHSVFDRWIKQYREYGTCVDNRGRCSKFQNPNKGRPRKTPERTLEEYSKEELIERCRMLEDIKKSFAYLESQKLKKNIK